MPSSRRRRILYVMKKLLLIVLFLLFTPSARAAITTPEIWRCTNEIRKEHNLKPLKLNRLLISAAELKAVDMDEYNYWSHVNPITREYSWPLFDKAGYIYKTAGENLAIGYATSKEVCENWKKSPLHYENLISNKYRDVGIYIREADLGTIKGVLVVQLFGRR